MLGVNIFMVFVMSAFAALLSAPIIAPAATNIPVTNSLLATSTNERSFKINSLETESLIPIVPFFSQFRDIHDSQWQGVGCGVTSLAMVIDYYHPNIASVDEVLRKAVTAGAYAKNAGWKHYDLAVLSGQYGLVGKSYDLALLDSDSAFESFKDLLYDGPIIVSAHYNFDPQSTIPHLLVVTGINGDKLYYNDPAGKTPGQVISRTDFLAGWKQRFIVIRPQA